MKIKSEQLVPFLIKLDILLGSVVLVLAWKNKVTDLDAQWYTINFFIFLGGIIIYQSTKNKIFIAVFIYALIFFSAVLMNYIIPGGLISEENLIADRVMSGALILLGVGGFFIGMYLNNKKK